MTYDGHIKQLENKPGNDKSTKFVLCNNKSKLRNNKQSQIRVVPCVGITSENSGTFINRRPAFGLIQSNDSAIMENNLYTNITNMYEYKKTRFEDSITMQ